MTLVKEERRSDDDCDRRRRRSRRIRGLANRWDERVVFEYKEAEGERGSHGVMAVVDGSRERSNNGRRLRR